MTALLATVMIHPIDVTRTQQMLLLLPLCLAVSVVYKTTKCATLREVPWAAVVSWVTIIVGMYAVGAGLLLLYHFVA